MQLFEPGYGPSGTSGTLRFDDIHARTGTDGQIHMLDDFEGRIKWTPLATSMISTDRLASTSEDVHGGDRAGLFSFGKDTNGGLRGFYQSPSGGAVPIVASTSFMSATGAVIGQDLIVTLMGHMVPVERPQVFIDALLELAGRI